MRLRHAKTETDRIRLSGLLDYARGITQCRRQSLLKMLNFDSNGEGPEAECCDVCKHQASAALREELSVLNFFHRNKRCYSVNEAAGILAQSKSHFWSEEDARYTINHLLAAGRLKESKNLLWKGKIS
jgi:hypothetical protein